jgi:hypothetical protein
MLHRQILEMVIILLAVVARRGYYEIQRPHITNIAAFNIGDRLAISSSMLLGLWATVETIRLNDFGLPEPDAGLLQCLHVWRWLSTLLPLGLMLLHQWLRVNFLGGLGRGLLSFGLPIGLLPILCWFPR